MPELASLKGWETTGHDLQKATTLLSALRLLDLPHVPNYLEISTAIRPEGLSTGLLSFGEVVLNFGQGALVYTPPSGQAVTVGLAGESQASLLEKILEAIEQTTRLFSNNQNPTPTRTEAFFTALQTTGHAYLPKKADLTDPIPLQIDAQVGKDYAQALYTVFTATARFRARLTGMMTPIVVWPEHFDLSFLWFPGGQADDSAPQMNFGFAPYTDGSIPRPYLYAYAYPMPDGFDRLPLPVGAHWNTEGWNGMVFPYDNLSQTDDPAAVIEAAFRHTFEQLAPSLPGVTIIPG